MKIKFPARGGAANPIANEISLLIHGPLDRHNLDEIRRKINGFTGKFGQIIVVSYTDDYDDYRKCLADNFSGLAYEIIPVKDVLNPGFCNINRQVVQMQAGLAAVRDGNFVLKLRNDQNIDFNKLFACIVQYKLFTGGVKILTTNCYSLKNRLYHPSDMFMCADKGIMTEYFDYPLMQRTAVQCEMDIKKMFRENPQMTFNPIAPESELFRNFLINRKWKILETGQDSEKAIKEFVYILNSWDIDFRWKKKRNWISEYENKIVLPYFHTAAPFDGAPVEKLVCYMRNEVLGGLENELDGEYIALAKKTGAEFEKSLPMRKKLDMLRRLIILLTPFPKVRKKLKNVPAVVFGILRKFKT